MKEKKDIDHLLRSSLDSYRPVPGPSRKGQFLEEAATVLPGKNRPGRIWWPLAIGIIFLVITGGIAWYMVTSGNDPFAAHDREPGEATGNTGTSTAVKDYPDSHRDSGQPISSLNTKTGQESPSSDLPLKDELDGSGLKEAFAATSSDPTKPVAATGFSPVPDTAGREDRTIGDSTFVNDKTKQLSAYLPETEIPSPDSVQNPEFETQNPEPETQNPEQGLTSMYSFFYKPDFLYRVEDNKKMMHTFGLEYQIRSSQHRYVIRAGIGISVSPGYYDYGIDYNEYLGTYLHLDSITFTLAEDNFHLEATYHQTEKEVFDSTLQTQYLTTDKRFAYLYIPVSLGYDFIRKDRFTLGLRAGPALSLLLNKKPEDPSYDAGPDQVVQVNLLTPLRNVMNWQVSGGLNLTILGKSNYFVEIEPAFTWYFKQLTGEGKGNENPWGIGARIAVGILPGNKDKR